MTWGNPLAWLGLLALAIPVLVHLLARRRSRRQPFPTLRFLEATPPVAARRSRLSDPLLMALRMLVVAAAVAALARPYFETDDRTARAAGASSVAVVVDTSWSMARPTPDGERAVEAARREAERSAEGSAVHTVIETADPGEALAGAAGWLEGRSGVREIRVVSDFQRGSLDSAHVAGVPEEVGLDLVRIPVDGAAGMPPRMVRHEASATEVRAAAGPDGTEARWVRVADEGSFDAAPSPLRLLHAPADSAAAAALRRALDLEAIPALDPARPVSVLFPGREDEAELLRSAEPPSEPWMGDAVLHLARDAELARLLDDGRMHLADAASPATPFVPVLTSRSGRPLVLAAELPPGGGAPDEPARLLVVTRFGPGSLESAALIAALAGAVDLSPPAHELEPEVLDEAELERWARAGVAAPASGSAPDGADSDGRWVWVLVLAFLVGEWLLRRRMRARVS